MSEQQKANEKVSTGLKQKPIAWDTITTTLLAAKSITPSLCRQALSRACLDSSVPSHAMKVVLRKAAAAGLEAEEMAKLLLSTVRCQNRTAAQALVHHDTSVLHWREVTRSRNTVLHLACERYGWNEIIGHLVEVTLEHHQDTQDGLGIFQPNGKGKSPLRLSLEAGADLSEIVSHLRSNHKDYLETNLWRLPEVIAEYCDDMSLLEDLMAEYPNLLQTTDQNNSTLLHQACYYQNLNMIRLLLTTFARRGERRRKLMSHLMNVLNNDGISPLGYLILGLGSMDAGNIFDCVHVCLQSVRNIPLLHYTIDKLWETLLAKERCLRTISRIVERLHIDLSSLDHGKSVLVMVIQKMTECNNSEEAQRVLKYVLTNCEAAASRLDGKKRIPLHIACENGLQWENGLQELVQANVSALGVAHPKSGLLPFALLTACSTTSLTSIYEILRHNPGFL